jgi:hypothetical protein
MRDDIRVGSSTRGDAYKTKVVPEDDAQVEILHTYPVNFMRDQGGLYAWDGVAQVQGE